MKLLIKTVILIIAASLLGSCTLFNTGDTDVEGAKMIAVIKNIDEKIEVEVIEGDYEVSGIFWVNTSSDTIYLDNNGNRTLRAFLKVGDTIEIVYSGQVMMSYPPQISAKKISVKVSGNE
jgi:hypothetical protein